MIRNDTIMRITSRFNIAVLLSALSLTLSSCLKDDDEVFDSSSSQRMQKTLEETKSVLRSAENGWVIDYFVGEDQVYGGYAFVVKFDSLTCTASSELSEGECTSYYKMTSDNGPVLTFDTYNEVLHALATPSSDNYEAYQADFEFLVLSATPELIVLKGKRSKNVMQMHPLSEPAAQYLAKVANISENMIVSTASGTLGGVTVNSTVDVDNRHITFVSTGDTRDSVDVAYTYTDTGIRLYNDLDVAGNTYRAFDYDAAGSKLISQGSGESFVLNCYRPENWQEYTEFEGTYDLYYGEGQYAGVARISLEPDEDGTGYLMKGLNSNFDIVCGYSKAKGALTIEPQSIGTDGSNEIYLCMLDEDGGYLSWASGVGLLISAVPGTSGSELEVTTNGYEEFISGGIVLWVFQSGSALSGSEVSSYFQSHTNWLMDGDYALSPMVKLVKIN